MIYLEPGVKNWSCPHKQEARLKTIIEPYLLLFGDRLPPNQQYWTLCGEMASNGNFLDGCELMQMVNHGLITTPQFNGVELNNKIHKLNIQAITNTTKPNLYNGELSDILDKELTKGTLSPGIVYVDAIQEPKGAAALLASVLDTLSQLPTGRACWLVPSQTFGLD